MSEKKSLIMVLESTLVLSFLFVLFYGLGGLFTFNSYADQRYFDVWSAIMMPPTGFPVGFFIASIIYAFIFSLIISVVYRFLRQSFKSKNQLFTGLLFGTMLFFSIFIPLYSHIFLIFNVPIIILLTWTASGFLFSFIGGIMLSLING